jgi:hypothetical protein
MGLIDADWLCVSYRGFPTTVEARVEVYHYSTLSRSRADKGPAAQACGAQDRGCHRLQKKKNYKLERNSARRVSSSIWQFQKPGRHCPREAATPPGRAPADANHAVAPVTQPRLNPARRSEPDLVKDRMHEVDKERGHRVKQQPAAQNVTAPDGRRDSNLVSRRSFRAVPHVV